MRGPRGPARHRRPSVAVLPRGECCSIFCGECRETWFFLYPRARGNAAQFFAGRFSGSGRELLGVPLVTKGKCCPIFRGAPGGVPRGCILHPRARGNAAQFFAGRCSRSGRELLGVSFSDSGEMLPNFSRGSRGVSRFRSIFFWHSRGWVEASPSLPNS